MMPFQSCHGNARWLHRVIEPEPLMDVLSVPGLETSKKDDLGVVEQTPRSCHNHYYYPLSFLHMILLNAVVCGVEVAACAGFVYIPPMLLKAGYSEEEMNLLMGIGPLLAVVFVPLIGRFSDSCHSSFGRRRPFILLLSAVLIFSMYLISFGGHFSLLVLGDTSLSRLLGVWCLSVGSILMDFTSQACLTPCEAMLSDMSANSNQHDRIFTIYSVMVSLGGILGYMLTAIDWTSNCIGAYFGNQEASIFSMLIIIFAIALTATITMANEVPFVGHSRPRTISCNELSINTNSSGCIECGNFSGDNTILLADNRCLQNPQESGYESSGSDDEGVIGLLTKDRLNLLNLRIRFTYFCSLIQCRRLGRLTEGVCSSVVRLGKVITAHFRSLSSLPLALRRLAITNFCSWTAVMGFNLYFTDFVGQVRYRYLSILSSRMCFWNRFVLFVQSDTHMLFTIFIFNGLCT